jgi:hypothetical protein
MVLVLLLVGGAVLLGAQALGLISFSSDGRLRAPSLNARVNAVGGEIPKVQVETADVAVGSKPVVVNVPKVTVGERQVDVRLPTIRIQRAGDEQEVEKYQQATSK